jgi:hypothetical protein
MLSNEALEEEEKQWALQKRVKENGLAHERDNGLERTC